MFGKKAGETIMDKPKEECKHRYAADVRNEQVSAWRHGNGYDQITKLDDPMANLFSFTYEGFCSECGNFRKFYKSISGEEARAVKVIIEAVKGDKPCS